MFESKRWYVCAHIRAHAVCMGSMCQNECKCVYMRNQLSPSVRQSNRLESANVSRQLPQAFLLLFWGEREAWYKAKRRKSWYVPIVFIWVKFGGKPSSVSGWATVGLAAHAFPSAERSQSSGERGRGRCKNEKGTLKLLSKVLGSGKKAIPPPTVGGFSRQLVNICLLVSF